MNAHKTAFLIVVFVFYAPAFKSQKPKTLPRNFAQQSSRYLNSHLNYSFRSVTLIIFIFLLRKQPTHVRLPSSSAIRLRTKSIFKKSSSLRNFFPINFYSWLMSRSFLSRWTTPSMWITLSLWFKSSFLKKPFSALNFYVPLNSPNRFYNPGFAPLAFYHLQLPLEPYFKFFWTLLLSLLI